MLRFQKVLATELSYHYSKTTFVSQHRRLSLRQFNETPPIEEAVSHPFNNGIDVFELAVVGNQFLEFKFSGVCQLGVCQLNVSWDFFMRSALNGLLEIPSRFD